MNIHRHRVYPIRLLKVAKKAEISKFFTAYFKESLIPYQLDKTTEPKRGFSPGKIRVINCADVMVSPFC